MTDNTDENNGHLGASLILILIFLAIVGTGYYLSNKNTTQRKELKQTRTEQLKEYAGNHQWNYSGGDFLNIPQNFRHLNLINTPQKSEYAVNLMTKKVGEAQFIFFDYYYSRGRGRTSKSILISRNPIQLSHCIIQPQRFLSNPKLPGSMPEIPLDAKDLLKKYVVQGENPDQVRQLLTQPMIDFLLQIHPVTIEINGTDILITRDTQQSSLSINDYYLSLDEITKLESDLLNFLDLIPPTFKTEQKVVAKPLF